MAKLYDFNTYIETGRRLANRLAAHYNPLSADPIERVPVVELLTALELAAEDLTSLCRQVPGGDLVTPADWKKAVVAANYIQKASDLYTYLLPLFNPVTGIPRLASQHLMVKPAWKNMQQNLLRWFFRAFVNRLGTHLIELYSGRLVIGADQYRKLTRTPVIDRLIAAGLDSIPGGGAEILVDRVRKLLNCYGKATADEWLDVMRARAPRRAADDGDDDVRHGRDRSRSGSSTCFGCARCRTRPAVSRRSSRGAISREHTELGGDRGDRRRVSAHARHRAASCSTTSTTCRRRG